MLRQNTNVDLQQAIERAGEQLETWRNTMGSMQHAHYDSAALYEFRAKILGGVVVFITTIVGVAFLLTTDNQAQNWVKILFGALSLIASGLSAVQTSLAYNERIRKHQIAGAQFGEIFRDIEIFGKFPPNSTEDIMEFLRSVKRRWDTIVTDVPTYPQKVWKKYAPRIGGEDYK
jgi:hypothetical protein